MAEKEELATYLHDHTNQEAAYHFGVNVRTVARWVKKYGLAYYELKYGDKPKELSELQKEAFVGTMLGDASLLKDGRYRFKQCIAHLEYVEHIHQIMQPFSRDITSDWTRRPSNTNGKVIDLETWNGDWLESKYFVTHRTPFFKIERKKWYIGKRKILPDDLVLTPRSCYYWGLDDGSNRPSRREFILSTQGFSIEEVDRLREMLKQLGIDTTRQMRKSGPIIWVMAHSYFDWINMIKPYESIDCLAYKTDYADATKPREGWGTGKLNFQKAQQIRRLYATDKYTQKELAAMFGVSETIIWRIVNYRAYRKTTQGFSGTADVHVSFKVEACPSGIKTDHS